MNLKTGVSYYKGDIVEYDMISANINILLEHDYIDFDTYKKLKNGSKRERVIYVGKLQKKNSAVNKCIMEEIPKVVSRFIEINEINEADIIVRVKDAVYVHHRFPPDEMILEVDGLDFSDKNRYSSAIIYDNGFKIFLTKDGKLDVKGISDKKMPLLNLMKTFLENLLIEKEQDGDVYNMIHDFLDAYKAYALPIDFYREFNATASFYDKDRNAYDMPYIPVQEMDIKYNIDFILSLAKVLL